jgi:uncharacterized membrane protein
VALVGLQLNRKDHAVTAKTLCATGVACLYCVTFSCRAVYHFPSFDQTPTFVLMSLITAKAFLLASRMEGRVIAVLGILGGFLTPVLLPSGVDNPAGLFGYIALLDIDLYAVALRRCWNFLVPLGATGTASRWPAGRARFFNLTKPPSPSPHASFLTRCFSRGSRSPAG